MSYCLILQNPNVYFHVFVLFKLLVIYPQDNTISDAANKAMSVGYNIIMFLYYCSLMVLLGILNSNLLHILTNGSLRGR